MWDIFKHFVDALKAAGISVNDYDFESTSDLVDGHAMQCHVRSIQQTGHDAMNVLMSMSLVCALWQAKEGADTKEEAIEKNFKKVIKTVYSSVSGSGADRCELIDSEIYFDVAEDYQSFAGMQFAIYFRQRVMS